MAVLTKDVRDVIEFVPWEMLFSLINLFIVYHIMKKLLYKPVKRMLEKRENEVSETYRLADEANENAQNLKIEYTKKMDSAIAEAKVIVDEAVKRASGKGDEILTEAKAKSDAMIQKAEDQIEHEKKSAANEMKNQITEIALIAASKLIERDLNDKDHKKLVDDFIENSGEIKWQR